MKTTKLLLFISCANAALSFTALPAAECEPLLLAQDQESSDGPVVTSCPPIDAQVSEIQKTCSLLRRCGVKALRILGEEGIQKEIQALIKGAQESCRQELEKNPENVRIKDHLATLADLEKTLKENAQQEPKKGLASIQELENLRSPRSGIPSPNSDSSAFSPPRAPTLKLPFRKKRENKQ